MALAGVALACGEAVAQQPREWGLGLQDAFSPIAREQNAFHNALLWIIFIIALFVLLLLLYAVWRFNERRNPKPSRTTHNTLVEVLWTVVPILILVGIGIPSLPLLYASDRAVDADMTIKAIGRQWYWSYEYPDHGPFTFDAQMVDEKDLKPGQPRLLTADEEVVVPVGKKVRLLLTASDVIHAWAMPAFGVKLDAVPGRINETWFEADTAGVYYGQCSEICGARHAYMPIVVRAVSEAEFQAWVANARQRFASATGDETKRQLAVAAPAARP
ncbi:MAG: cytochrome c oxidase subunit II [Alphaproteobacteria bacterium]|nr:cytochrome c oxidase subunit II [Alphaproteobacteria bacterium]